MNKYFSTGSNWNKWDLHLHSPSTALNNQFAGDTIEEKWDKYIKKISELKDIKVLGITDYFSIEGYIKLKSYKDSRKLDNIDLILPNVEMRITPVTKTETPINIHMIFSPDVVQDLENKFFRNLKYDYRGESYSCTREDLIKLGREFRNDASLAENIAYCEGVNQFKTDINKLRAILSNSKLLKENVIVVVPNSNNDGNSGIQECSMASTREEIYRFADCIFSSNPKDSLFFLGKGPLSKDDIIDKYGALKPCIHGCDAHCLDKICKPDKDRFTWIKAETTFLGLKQILIEPEERVYIGDISPVTERINKNSNKYIKSILISKNESFKEEIWFDNVTVDFNPQLVAIIGNKGNGKSALADIIGLSGYTKNHSSFSFLNPHRFRKKKLANNFYASLEWVNGDTITDVCLQDNPESFKDERVKYIPQAFLENTCNDENTQFENEIKEVIFSHIPEEKKLGKSSLDELMLYLSEETSFQITDIQKRLSTLNVEITKYENALTDEYKLKVNENLKNKKVQLVAHESKKPKEVSQPEINKEVNDKIENVNNQIATLELSINEIKVENIELNKKIATIDKIDNRIQNFIASIIQTKNGIDTELSENNIDIKFDELFVYKLDTEKISIKKNEFEDRKNYIESELDAAKEESLMFKLSELNKELDGLNNSLNGPIKEFQQYKNNLKEWTETKEAISGNEKLKDSVKYYENILDLIDTQVPEYLEKLKIQRIEVVKQICEKKLKLINIYKELNASVEVYYRDYISKLSIPDEYKVDFKVSLELNNFKEEFFKNINRRTAGSFYETSQSEYRLNNIIDDKNFNSEEEVILFINEIIGNLEFDKRDNKNNQKNEISKQIINGMVKEFYDFMFGLNFINPVYKLMLGNKEMAELSPGEKGALLLVFYLLIDKNDIPLIIDQPEENLDNQSVYNLLVSCIKEAKKRRQIIIVTHNPNLAVVCDAEQIICCKIDKQDKNKVIYESGAIETPLINKNIIDILEGTLPAFKNRDIKYSVTKNLK